MGRSHYQSAFEQECEQARKKAERFFKRLLKEAHQLPKTKVLLKAPAAIAAAYALCGLMDGPEAQEPVVALAMVGRTLKLFEAEVEKARKQGKKHGRVDAQYLP